MKLNWGTSIVIVYSIFVAIMITFAVKASRIKYDLVTDNYYDEAVKFQDRIDENENAINANSRLSITFDNQTSSIILNVSGNQKTLNGKLAFYKPDKASEDFNLNFETDFDGFQLIPLSDIAHGSWKVSATYEVNGKNCLEEVRIFIP